MLKRIDYTDEGSLNLYNYYEWRGQVIMFGDKSLMILSVPPTLNPPKNMLMSYQTKGSLNKTFALNFTKILYVLPKSKETGSLAVVNSRLLGAEKQSSMQRHSSTTDRISKSIIFIDEVYIGSPNLHFNQSDEELLNQKTCTIDVYYNLYPNYVRKRYVIEFIDNKPNSSLWLEIFLGVVLVLFFSISILCVIKARKALRKVKDPASMGTSGLALTPGLATGNRQGLIRGMQDELINQTIPSRLRNRDLIGT